MARPRQGVTLENAQSVYLYFRNTLKSFSRHDKVLKPDGDYSFEATEALEKIESAEYCDIIYYQKARKKKNKNMMKYMGEGIITYETDILDQWVIKYITKKGWQQCLSNIRQAKHSNHKRYEKTQIKINTSTLYSLKSLAEEHPGSRSLDDYLKELIYTLNVFRVLAEERNISTLELLNNLLEKENTNSSNYS